MKYLLVYRINFKDGGEPEFGLLYEGWREDCQRASSLCPAIAYKGSRLVDHAEHLIVPVEVGIDVSSNQEAHA